MQELYIRGSPTAEGGPLTTNKDNIYQYRVFRQRSASALASVGVRAKTRELLSAGTRLAEYGVFLTPFAMGVVIPSSLPPPTVARSLDNFCSSQILSRASIMHACSDREKSAFGFTWYHKSARVCCILLNQVLSYTARP